MVTVINITKDYIYGGKRGDRTCCPVALALKEKTGRSWYVDTDVIIDKDTGYSIDTPDIVREFIYGFDSGNEPEPFEFEIWIYE